MNDEPRKPPSAPDAMVRIRLDGSVAAWDDAARQMFGRSRAATVGRRFAGLFARECRHEMDSLAGTSRSRPLRLVATAIRKDGSRFEAEVTATAAYSRGRKDGVVVLVRDVTAPAAASAAIAAFSGPSDSGPALASLGDALRTWIPLLYLSLGVIEGERYRRIADPASMPIALLDGQRLRLHGSPVQAALERRAPVVVHDTRRSRYRCDPQLADLGVASYAVMPIVRDDKVFATLNVGFARTRRPTRSVIDLLSSVCADLAAPLARTLEFEEQSRSVRRLEAIDRLEKDFLALITHDMRTPLAVIAGFASSLREKWDELPDAAKLEGLDAIARNGRNLALLVEQDLEVALLEQGELPYEIAPFDLAGQVDAIVQDFAGTTSNRFIVHVEKALPLVLGDEQRNWQVLANLLSNAVKFSKVSAPVELHVFREGPMAYVAVRDHGIGINAGDIPHLFRKFSRVGSNGARKARGIGLGLYLAKCLVEAQGGRIWVESRNGDGSTFTYTLPVAGERGATDSPLDDRFRIPAGSAQWS
jgi:PAS domain S-box-containing protein